MNEYKYLWSPESGLIIWDDADHHQEKAQELGLAWDDLSGGYIEEEFDHLVVLDWGWAELSIGLAEALHERFNNKPIKRASVEHTARRPLWKRKKDRGKKDWVPTEWSAEELGEQEHKPEKWKSIPMKKRDPVYVYDPAEYNPNQNYRWAYHPVKGLYVWLAESAFHIDWERLLDVPDGEYAGGVLETMSGKRNVAEYHANERTLSFEGINKLMTWFGLTKDDVGMEVWPRSEMMTTIMKSPISPEQQWTDAWKESRLEVDTLFEGDDTFLRFVEYDGMLYFSTSGDSHWDMLEVLLGGRPGYDDKYEMPSAGWVHRDKGTIGWYTITPEAIETLEEMGYHVPSSREAAEEESAKLQEADRPWPNNYNLYFPFIYVDRGGEPWIAYEYDEPNADGFGGGFKVHWDLLEDIGVGPDPDEGDFDGLVFGHLYQGTMQSTLGTYVYSLYSDMYDGKTPTDLATKKSIERLLSDAIEGLEQARNDQIDTTSNYKLYKVATDYTAHTFAFLGGKLYLSLNSGKAWEHHPEMIARLVFNTDLFRDDTVYDRVQEWWVEQTGGRYRYAGEDFGVLEVRDGVPDIFGYHQPLSKQQKKILMEAYEAGREITDLSGIEAKVAYVEWLWSYIYRSDTDELIIRRKVNHNAILFENEELLEFAEENPDKVIFGRVFEDGDEPGSYAIQNFANDYLGGGGYPFRQDEYIERRDDSRVVELVTEVIKKADPDAKIINTEKGHDQWMNVFGKKNYKMVEMAGANLETTERPGTKWIVDHAAQTIYWWYTDRQDGSMPWHINFYDEVIGEVDDIYNIEGGQYGDSGEGERYTFGASDGALTPEEIAANPIRYYSKTATDVRSGVRWIEMEDGTVYTDDGKFVGSHWELGEMYDIDWNKVVDIGLGKINGKQYLDTFYRNPKPWGEGKPDNPILDKLTSEEFDYATRWIKLKDGRIITDSSEFDTHWEMATHHGIDWDDVEDIGMGGESTMWFGDTYKMWFPGGEKNPKNEPSPPPFWERESATVKLHPKEQLHLDENQKDYGRAWIYDPVADTLYVGSWHGGLVDHFDLYDVKDERLVYGWFNYPTKNKIEAYSDNFEGMTATPEDVERGLAAATEYHNNMYNKTAALPPPTWRNRWVYNPKTDELRVAPKDGDDYHFQMARDWGDNDWGDNWFGGHTLTDGKIDVRYGLPKPEQAQRIYELLAEQEDVQPGLWTEMLEPIYELKPTGPSNLSYVQTYEDRNMPRSDIALYAMDTDRRGHMDTEASEGSNLLPDHSPSVQQDLDDLVPFNGYRANKTPIKAQLNAISARNNPERDPSNPYTSIEGADPHQGCPMEGTPGDTRKANFPSDTIFSFSDTDLSGLRLVQKECDDDHGGGLPWIWLGEAIYVGTHEGYHYNMNANWDEDETARGRVLPGMLLVYELDSDRDQLIEAALVDFFSKAPIVWPHDLTKFDQSVLGFDVNDNEFYQQLPINSPNPSVDTIGTDSRISVSENGTEDPNSVQREYDFIGVFVYKVAENEVFTKTDGFPTHFDIVYDWPRDEVNDVDNLVFGWLFEEVGVGVKAVTASMEYGGSRRMEDVDAAVAKLDETYPGVEYSEAKPGMNQWNDPSLQAIHMGANEPPLMELTRVPATEFNYNQEMAPLLYFNYQLYQGESIDYGHAYWFERLRGEGKEELADLLEDAYMNGTWGVDVDGGYVGKDNTYYFIEGSPPGSAIPQKISAALSIVEMPPLEVPDQARSYNGHPVIEHQGTLYIGPLGSHHWDILSWMEDNDIEVGFESKQWNIWPESAVLGQWEVQDPIAYYGLGGNPEVRETLREWAKQNYWNKLGSIGAERIVDHTDDWGEYDYEYDDTGFYFKYLYDADEDTLHIWRTNTSDGFPAHYEAFELIYGDDIYDDAKRDFDHFTWGFGSDEWLHHYKHYGTPELHQRTYALVNQWLEAQGKAPVKTSAAPLQVKVTQEVPTEGEWPIIYLEDENTIYLDTSGQGHFMIYDELMNRSGTDDFWETYDDTREAHGYIDIDGFFDWYADPYQETDDETDARILAAVRQWYDDNVNARVYSRMAYAGEVGYYRWMLDKDGRVEIDSTEAHYDLIEKHWGEQFAEELYSEESFFITGGFLTEGDIIIVRVENEEEFDPVDIAEAVAAKAREMGLYLTGEAIFEDYTINQSQKFRVAHKIAREVIPVTDENKYNNGEKSWYSGIYDEENEVLWIGENWMHHDSIERAMDINRGDGKNHYIAYFHPEQPDSRFGTMQTFAYAGAQDFDPEEDAEILEWLREQNPWLNRPPAKESATQVIELEGTPGSNYKWIYNPQTSKFYYWPVGNDEDGLPAHNEQVPEIFGLSGWHELENDESIQWAVGWWDSEGKGYLHGSGLGSTDEMEAKGLDLANKFLGTITAPHNDTLSSVMSSEKLSRKIKIVSVGHNGVEYPEITAQTPIIFDPLKNVLYVAPNAGYAGHKWIYSYMEKHMPVAYENMDTEAHGYYFPPNDTRGSRFEWYDWHEVPDDALENGIRTAIETSFGAQSKMNISYHDSADETPHMTPWESMRNPILAERLPDGVLNVWVGTPGHHHLDLWSALGRDGVEPGEDVNAGYYVPRTWKAQLSWDQPGRLAWLESYHEITPEEENEMKLWIQNNGYEYVHDLSVESAVGGPPIVYALENEYDLSEPGLDDGIPFIADPDNNTFYFGTPGGYHADVYSAWPEALDTYQEDDPHGQHDYWADTEYGPAGYIYVKRDGSPDAWFYNGKYNDLKAQVENAFAYEVTVKTAKNNRVEFVDSGERSEFYKAIYNWEEDRGWWWFTNEEHDTPGHFDMASRLGITDQITDEDTLDNWSLLTGDPTDDQLNVLSHTSYHHRDGILFAPANYKQSELDRIVESLTERGVKITAVYSGNQKVADVVQIWEEVNA